MKSIILLKLTLMKQMLSTVLIFTGMAIGFVYVFGTGFGSAYVPTVSIIDEDQSEVSQKLMDRLETSKSFNFEYGNYEDSIASLKKSHILGVIYIEEGFEEELALNNLDKLVLYINGAAVEQNTLKSMLANEISEIKGNINFSKGFTQLMNSVDVSLTADAIYEKVVNEKEQYPANTLTSEVYKSNTVDYDATKHYFSGFLIFFSLFTIMFGMSSIVKEKEVKVWQRQIVSPLSNRQIILGNLITNFLLGSAQLAFIVLLAKFLFGIDWGGSTLALILVLAAFSIAGTAMGLFCVGFVKTEQQLSALLPTVIVATSMIGGCMWPIDMIDNKLLVFLANLTPQRWAMSGIKKVLIYNGSLNDVVMPIIYLMIITAVFFILSTVVYRRLSTNN